MSGRVPLPTPAWKQADNLDTIVPSDMDQATGLERAEMLAGLEGRKIFEEEAVSIISCYLAQPPRFGIGGADSASRNW